MLTNRPGTQHLTLTPSFTLTFYGKSNSQIGIFCVIICDFLQFVAKTDL